MRFGIKTAARGTNAQGYGRNTIRRFRKAVSRPTQPAAWGLLIVVAIAALAGILITSALISRPAVRGYAEFQAEPGACFLIRERTFNALDCRYVSSDVYEITFARDLGGSAPVATRASCCPGFIGVSLSERRSVIVSLTGERAYPVRAQVVVP